MEVKPGLSGFMKNQDYASEEEAAQQAAASLDSMLQKALQTIPPLYQNSTPLTVMATAGLRLLPVRDCVCFHV